MLNFAIWWPFYFLAAILFIKQEQKVLQTSAPRVNFIFSKQKSKNIHLKRHKTSDIVLNRLKQPKINRNIGSQKYQVSEILSRRNIGSQKYQVTEISDLKNIGCQKYRILEISGLRNIGPFLVNFLEILILIIIFYRKQRGHLNDLL